MLVRPEAPETPQAAPRPTLHAFSQREVGSMVPFSIPCWYSSADSFPASLPASRAARKPSPFQRPYAPTFATLSADESPPCAASVPASMAASFNPS